MNDTTILAILGAGGSVIMVLGTASFTYLLNQIKKNEERYELLEKHSNLVESIVNHFMTNLAVLIGRLDGEKKSEISSLIIKVSDKLEQAQSNFLNGKKDSSK